MAVWAEPSKTEKAARLTEFIEHQYARRLTHPTVGLLGMLISGPSIYHRMAYNRLRKPGAAGSREWKRYRRHVKRTGQCDIPRHKWVKCRRVTRIPIEIPLFGCDG